jgi:hypothetical protein
MLTESHGGKEAARVFSRILGATLEHGEEAVAGERLSAVAVPEALCGYQVEAARAKDYDWLLQTTDDEPRGGLGLFGEGGS